MLPSGFCTGAWSHRVTYRTTHGRSVLASTALTMRSRGTESKNFSMSRSIIPGRDRPCGRPPDRSQRALLVHWAPTLGAGVESDPEPAPPLDLGPDGPARSAVAPSRPHHASRRSPADLWHSDLG